MPKAFKYCAVSLLARPTAFSGLIACRSWPKPTTLPPKTYHARLPYSIGYKVLISIFIIILTYKAMPTVTK